jgi:ribosomal protein S18 acetylase RimI-like enzyme
LADSADRNFPVPPPLIAGGIALRHQSDDDQAMQQALYIESRNAEFAALALDPAFRTQLLAQQSQMQQRHYAAHYPGAEFYTVLEHATPIGRFYIDRSGRSEIRLVDLIFCARKRGQGLGTAFVQAVQAEARASGRFAGLHVEVHNPARRLYLRLGFTETEARPPYIYMTWQSR